MKVKADLKRPTSCLDSLERSKDLDFVRRVKSWACCAYLTETQLVSRWSCRFTDWRVARTLYSCGDCIAYVIPSLLQHSSPRSRIEFDQR
jgi:hypothetical protein